MAEVTASVTIGSTDLATDSLNLSKSFSFTASHTEGLARKKVTSTAKGTASGQVVLYTADSYAAPVMLYVCNTSTSASDYIQVYVDTSTDDPDLLKIAGGQWAFLPLNGDETVTAYASSSIVVEYMVFGTEA